MRVRKEAASFCVKNRKDLEKSVCMSQVYHHPKIGDIRLLPNTRCRGLKYSISSKGALISFNPLFADRVLPLPADKEEWFLRHKERIGRQANKYMYDAGSRLQTTAFEIRFVEEGYSPRDCCFSSPSTFSRMRGDLGNKRYAGAGAERRLPGVHRPGERPEPVQRAFFLQRDRKSVV